MIMRKWEFTLFCLTLVIIKCTATGQETCWDISVEDTVSCDFDRGSCEWKNCGENCSSTVQWESRSHQGNSYMLADLHGTETGSKGTLISTVQCPMGDTYYELKFKYWLNCPNNNCQLLVYLRRTDTNEAQLLWSETVQTPWTSVATPPLLSRDSNFQFLFEAEKLKNNNNNNLQQIGIDKIQYENTGVIATTPATTTPTAITTYVTNITTTTTATSTEASNTMTTSRTPTVTSTTPSKTTTTITTTTTTSATPSTSTTTSNKETRTTGDFTSAGPDTTPEQTSAGDSDAEARKDKDNSVGIGIGVTVSVLVVVGVMVAVFIIIRRRQNNSDIMKSLPIPSCLKRSRPGASGEKVMEPGVHENKSSFYDGADNVDNLYSQVKNPKIRNAQINGNGATSPTTHTVLCTQEAGFPGESPRGNQGKREADEHYSTPRNAAAPNQSACTNRESVYELASMGQQAAIYSTPRKTGKPNSNKSLDCKPQETQDEYNMLVRGPPRPANGGLRTDHTYDHTEKLRMGVPKVQIGESKNCAANPGGSHVRKQHYENVKSSTMGSPTPGEEYNCLEFDHGRSVDVTGKGQRNTDGQDVYNHLKA